MQYPAVQPPISTSSMVVRVAIAFLLGAQLGLIALFNLNVSSRQWIALIPMVVVLVALVLSILLSPEARSGVLPRKRILRVILRMLTGIIAPLFGLALVGLILPFLLPLLALAIVMEMSMIAAFTVGSETRWLAIMTGESTWVGLSIFLIIAASAQLNEPGNNLGGLVLGIVIVGAVLGCFLAIPGGLLGRVLRAWVFRI